MPASRITAYLSVGGQNIAVKSLELSYGKTKKGDTFKATLAMMDPRANNIVQLGGQTVTVVVNDTPAKGQYLLEQVDYCFDTTEIEVSGRDIVAATLLDNGSADPAGSETFTNQTANQVVQKLVMGFPLEMDQAGDPLAGKIYTTDWNAILHRQSSWDAICNIADIYGLNAFFTGGTVYLKWIGATWPQRTVFWNPPSAMGYATGNFLRMKCSKNFQMSKQISVTTNSWNHKQKKIVTATATDGGSSDGTQFYQYRGSGHTQEQVKQLSTKKANEHAKHALNIELLFAGDMSWTPLLQIQVTGTGGPFDTIYDVEHVDHHIVCESGHHKGGRGPSTSSYESSQSRGGFTTTVIGKTSGVSSGAAGSAAGVGSGGGAG